MAYSVAIAAGGDRRHSGGALARQILLAAPGRECPFGMIREPFRGVLLALGQTSRHRQLLEIGPLFLARTRRREEAKNQYEFSHVAFVPIAVCPVFAPPSRLLRDPLAFANTGVPGRDRSSPRGRTVDDVGCGMLGANDNAAEITLGACRKLRGRYHAPERGAVRKAPGRRGSD